MGLYEPDAIRDRKTADLLIMHNGTHQIEGTIRRGCWSHPYGALAACISAAPQQIAHATY
jgi:hypothetical protein